MKDESEIVFEIKGLHDSIEQYKRDMRFEDIHSESSPSCERIAKAEAKIESLEWVLGWDLRDLQRLKN